MAEIKKGYSITNFEAQRESELLAPYPSWPGWKHTIINHFKQRSIEFNPSQGVEILLHEWYIMRRLRQKKDIDEEEFDKRRRVFSQRFGEFLDDPKVSAAIRFVTDKTEIPTNNRH